jgi:hypothetical protein
VPTIFLIGTKEAPSLLSTKKRLQVPRMLIGTKEAPSLLSTKKRLQSEMFGVLKQPRGGASAKAVVATNGRFQLFVVWLQRRSWWGFLFSMGGVSQNGMKDKVSSVFLRCCVCSCISFLVVWRM